MSELSPITRHYMVTLYMQIKHANDITHLQVLMGEWNRSAASARSWPNLEEATNLFRYALDTRASALLGRNVRLQLDRAGLSPATHKFVHEDLPPDQSRTDLGLTRGTFLCTRWGSAGQAIPQFKGLGKIVGGITRIMPSDIQTRYRRLYFVDTLRWFLSSYLDDYTALSIFDELRERAQRDGSSNLSLNLSAWQLCFYYQGVAIWTELQSYGRRLLKDARSLSDLPRDLTARVWVGESNLSAIVGAVAIFGIFIGLLQVIGMAVSGKLELAFVWLQIISGSPK